MASDVHTASDVPGGHPEQHVGATPRTYVTIGLILAVITLLELGGSFLNQLGFPEWVQVIVLISLASLKGTLVVLFFMHLKFDSRWFGFLFVSGLIIAVFMVIGMLLLFSYRAGQSL